MVALIVLLALIGFVLLVLARTIGIVPQARAGVVERFGRYQRTLAPGLALVVRHDQAVDPARRRRTS
jgi:regulator of protease activity HflC (stomatin/prohibitin superfamily)